MSNSRATTIAEAEAQRFDLPTFKAWRQFAGMMDGYRIAEELDLDYHTWYPARKQHWETTGHWDLEPLYLRLMLFFAFRADYMSGYTYTEQDEIVDSLLHELSQQLNLPYDGIGIDSDDAM